MSRRILLLVAAMVSMFCTAIAQPRKAESKTGNAYDVSKADTLLDFSKFDWGGDKTGNAIKSVTIGKQIWMAENLATDKFRNGDPIPQVSSKEEWLSCEAAKRPAWCYYNNDPANGARYGKLYNWYAVKDPRGLAPSGWHVPTEDEWGTLIYTLGGQGSAGEKMRSTSGWREKGNGNNESGFNALPGSCRDHYAIFYEPGTSGYWWSATPFITGSAGYAYQIQWYGIVAKSIYTNDALSVRCVKD